MKCKYVEMDKCGHNHINWRFIFQLREAVTFLECKWCYFFIFVSTIGAI
jgi:hypothetical protein